ncbi:MAG: hypothetical protein AAF320_06780, partial [Myxococcota bacterium]
MVLIVLLSAGFFRQWFLFFVLFHVFSVCLSVGVFVCLSVSLSVYLSICPFGALFDGNRLLDHSAENTRCTMGEALVEGTV